MVILIFRVITLIEPYLLIIPISKKNIATNFNINRNAMKFSATIYPNKQLVFDTGIRKNHNVLPYGEVSKSLIKETIKAVGKNGAIYIIGRDGSLIKYKSFIKKKYSNRVFINPFFENLPVNSVDYILTFNAKLDYVNVSPLAEHGHSILKENGEVIIFDDTNTWDELIILCQQTPLFKHIKNDKILRFGKA